MSLGDIGLELVVWAYQFAPVILTFALGLGIGLWSRRRVRRALRAGSTEPAPEGETAGAFAQAQIARAGLADTVAVVTTRGPLATFFDPTRRELRLREALANSRSLAGKGLAAHEVGHALQQAQGFRPLVLRTPLVFASGLGSRAAWVVFVVGVVLDYPELAMRGALLLLAVIVAAALIVPIEIDANRRASQSLSDGPDGADLARSLRPGFEAAIFDHLAATLPWSSQPASDSLMPGRASAAESPRNHAAKGSEGGA